MIKNKHIWCFILVLFLAGCAAQAPPSGGPEDKTPPELVSIYPENEALNVPVDQSITFTFSETINPSNVQISLTLFPLNTTEISLKIRRNRVTISPKTQWDNEKVYSLIFNRSIQDLRGNNLEEPIVYTFSTGSYIPQGSITGSVPNFTPKDRVLIGLAEGEWRPDSVFNHLSYLTEVDKEGKYQFQAIPPGVYTLSGIVDHDKSKSYSPTFDDLALPETLIVTMTDSTRSVIDLGIVRGNFVPVNYITGKNLFPTITALKFTKQISAENSPTSFIINDFPADTFRSEGNDVYIYHPMIKDSIYSLYIITLKDTLGVVGGPFLDTLLVTTFNDTVGKLLWRDNTLILEPPIKCDTLNVTLLTTSDTLEHYMISQFPGRFIPDKRWGITDFSGRLVVNVPLPEDYPSVIRWSDTLSIKYQAEREGGRFILHVPESFEDKVGFILTGEPRRYQNTLETPGTCIFENVLAGEYSLWYYLDKNKNSRQDYGWMDPYQPPEIARPLLQNIQIRARWDTEITVNRESE